MECADRKLDPLTTNLVVADQSRTDKTICLAVSPALKACGIPGRPRLFEVVQKVRDVNRLRGNVEAMYEMGVSFDLGIGLPMDEFAAEEWYRKAAEHGHEEAKKILNGPEKLE